MNSSGPLDQASASDLGIIVARGMAIRIVDKAAGQLATGMASRLHTCPVPLDSIAGSIVEMNEAYIGALGIAAAGWHAAS